LAVFVVEEAEVCEGRISHGTILYFY